jgi:mono/diheme cytochrome c family protein
MYYVDPDRFMNAVMLAVLATAAVLMAASIATAGIRRKRWRRGRSYLYMLTALFAVFAAVVLVGGFRGQTGSNRPWHFFLDMKYQGKYVNQGASKFFADGRQMRLPPEHTIPFDGTDYSADAGYHADPNPDFLKADPRYYLGVANRDAKENRDGVPVPKDPEWKDGKLVEGYYVGRIPAKAVADAGGWEPLLKRGRHQFDVYCAACHGQSGRGGDGELAHGIVGAYGLKPAPPANLHTDEIRSQPDGQLFNVVTHGVRNMPGYGHQVKVPDRWAVVAHIRVLQFMHQPPGGK